MIAAADGYCSNARKDMGIICSSSGVLDILTRACSRAPSGSVCCKTAPRRACVDGVK